MLPSGEKNNSVEELRWDQLSNIYLIAAYRNGSIILWDIECGTELHTFEKQSSGINSIHWYVLNPSTKH